MCSFQDLWRLLSETSKVQADYTELFDQESEIGFNKAKAVWDRQRVLEAKGAAIFQRRLLAGLRAEQPVKKLLAEVRDARRHPALFQTVVRSASAAKAISDFADQELKGGRPLVRPSNETGATHGRKREYLSTFVPAARAGGGARDDPIELEEIESANKRHDNGASRLEFDYEVLAALPPLSPDTLAAIPAAGSSLPSTPPTVLPCEPVSTENEHEAEGEVVAHGIAVEATDSDSDSDSSSDLESDEEA